MSCWGERSWFAKSEAQNYDSVTLLKEADGSVHFRPVQIKELVPHDLNLTAEIQSIIDALWRYGAAPELTAAIHVNRRTNFEPAALRIPSNVEVDSLWAFMALTPDQFGEWVLFGNLLAPTDSRGCQFRYRCPRR